MQTTRVWDLPTRLFHWLLALAVMGLVITGQVGGSWMDWHFRLGYCVLTLLLFRMVWGFIGGHWSRFVHFFCSAAQKSCDSAPFLLLLNRLLRGVR